MCLVPDPPKAKIVESSDPAAAAAADALAMQRKNAQGYTASIMGGGNTNNQPSLARQLLGAG